MSHTSYIVPTHLTTADKLLFGCTARQLIILLCAGSLAYLIWLHLSWCAAWGTPGLVVRLLAVVPVVLAGVSGAFVQIADRPLEIWCLIWVLYYGSPRQYLWQSAPSSEDAALPFQREGECSDAHA